MIDALLLAAIAKTLGGSPPGDTKLASMVDDATLLDSILPSSEVAAFLIIALVVYLLFLRVRINAMTATVADACAGETSKDRRPGGIDALGRLSWSIDVLIEVHSTSLNAISSHASGVGQAANQLRLVSEQMGRFADDTSEEAMTVSTASSEVSESIQAVAASAEELDVGMREIARSAAEAARVAMEAVGVAESTNQTVSTLVKNSAEIESVIKVISGITEQTNLLALNAAIEAARAGEAGKGFAVVATEVKELAFETARAAEEVAGKVGAIQQSSRGAVDAIQDICEIIHKISEIQAAIASSVEEQTSASKEIGRSVTQAAASGAEITQNIAGVAEKSSATMKSAVEIRQAADEVGLMALEIEQLLQPFRETAGKSR